MRHGHGARGARPEQNLSMGRKGKSEGKFGSKMVKVALIKAIGKTVKDPALLETLKWRGPHRFVMLVCLSVRVS